MSELLAETVQYSGKVWQFGARQMLRELSGRRPDTACRTVD